MQSLTSPRLLDRSLDWRNQVFLWGKRLAAHTSFKLYALAGVLTLTVFAFYVQTLVPSVLDADQGELQYIPAILGIPHPTGFPLYVLLGFLWSHLPIGSVAYRMNLLSAVFGALAIGLLFIALSRQKLRTIAALGAAITLALLPPFWEHSTIAAVYTLHAFLGVVLFLVLAEWEAARDEHWLMLVMLTLGLGLTNHPSFVFFIPATLIYLRLVGGRRFFRQPSFYRAAALGLVPLVLYLYFPLRAAQLQSNSFALPSWSMEMARGLIPPFYRAGPIGLIRYLTAQPLVSYEPDSLDVNFFWTNLSTIVLQYINLPALGIMVIGLLALRVRRAKIAVWSLLVFMSFGLITFFHPVARYLLPSFMALMILGAYGIDGILVGSEKLFVRLRLPVLPLSLIVRGLICLGLLFSWKILLNQYSSDLRARSQELEEKWRTVQRYPPEQNAALVAHWGDLTPLWYYQHAEGWRPDLVTIYPPTDDQVTQWLATGKPLYLAGSPLKWLPELSNRYYLTPWGPLVRVTPSELVPGSPLSHAMSQTFRTSRPLIRLIGYDLSHLNVPVGDSLDIAAYWQLLDSMTLSDYVLLLSLSDGQKDIAARTHSLVVNWLPGERLQSNQRALSTYKYRIPWGTRPGTYHLRLRLRAIQSGRDLRVVEAESSQSFIDLGTIHVDPPAAYPDSLPLAHAVNADMDHRMTLLGWTGMQKRLNIGDAPTIHLFWKAKTVPQEPLNIGWSLENGAVSRQIATSVLDKDYPTSQWHPGEILRLDSQFTIPADLEGDYNLVLRVLDDEQKVTLPWYDNWLSRRDGLTLARVHITGRAHSFALPTIPKPQSAQFENKIALLGYELKPNAFKDNTVQLRLFWQALDSIGSSYKVFIHLVGGNGNIVAQHDSIPGAGTLPTSSWLPNEIISDSAELKLPPNLPTGVYQIRVGWYNETTGQRLNVTTTDNPAAGDYVLLNDTVAIPIK
ncbi:MAG TPA: DUF2723 domain-containing protein [Anaerolineae bacterium]|nr:DUF2723 domain-containing protein [Anaerolineae bacterium]